VTRIPELEQELVAAAARLRSPRRLVRPAARVALAAAALAAAVVIAIVGAVDHDGHRGGQPSAPTAPPNPDMVDHEAGVAFALEGRVLTVRLLPSAPHETRLKVDGKRIRATCAKGFTEGPGPGPGPDPRQTSTRLWPAGRTVMRFRFAGDISRIATTCRLEDPVAGHVAFVKFRTSRPSQADAEGPIPPDGIENSPEWAAFTPEQRIESTGNRWARRFAASASTDCRFTAQPFCERLSCEPISGPIENCTKPSARYRESFRDATIEDVVIKGQRAAARFSNGEVIELGHIHGYAVGGLWWIDKLGGNAGRNFFK
jgi:hypothetical protein